MKRIVVLLLFLNFGFVQAQNNTIQIIPQPVEVQAMDGNFTLTKEATIAFNKPEARHVAGMLADRLNKPTGFNIAVQQERNGSIQLDLNDTEDAQLGDEGYRLESSPKGVAITANKPAGLFYGMQTLLQLLPKEIESQTTTQANWTVPAVKITDYPRFGWRGLMLDVSRHFFDKAEVERYIDDMVRYKYNVFHWHLTDDNGWRIEIKSLPKLTSVGAWRVPRTGHFGDLAAPMPGEKATYGGFYTQDDIREIVKYAQDRFVTIVPEIDVPGHSMAAIAAYPELSCTQDTSIKVNPGSKFSEWYGNGKFKMLIDNTLNPSDEKVYQFLDKVFTEVAALFPNPYIHAGGDECYKGYWEKDPGCQALMKKMHMTNVEQLQGYFMGRVEKILQSKGKKLIGWDEILDGGISPGATVMSWRGIKGGIEAAKLGHNVVMTPTTFAYLDYTQGDPSVDPPVYAHLRMEKCYSFDPVPEGVDPKYILGGQGNLWTEQLPVFSSLEYMTYPRAWALAEDFWSPNGSKDWNNFISRTEHQFTRLDEAGIDYSKAIYDAIVKPSMQNGKLMLALSTEVPGLDIYYTINGTMPDIYSKKYQAPIEIPEAPITLRVVTYRDGKPIGHLITLNLEELKRRAKK